MMWTALGMRLFVVIRRSVSVTFKAVKLERRVRSPRSPSARAVFPASALGSVGRARPSPRPRKVVIELRWLHRVVDVAFYSGLRGECGRRPPRGAGDGAKRTQH